MHLHAYNQKITDKPHGQLIKERKKIITSITKVSDETQSKLEAKSLQSAARAGINVPEFISAEGDKLTMTFCPGISVFRFFETYKGKNRQQLLETSLKKMADDILIMQSSCTDAISLSYPFEEKFKEIIEVLSVLGYEDESIDLNTILPELVNSLQASDHKPFRDATPKNYIFKDLDVQNVQKEVGLDDLEIVSIDFATFHYGTHKNDDMISLFYHYMVPVSLRERLVSEYMTDQSEVAAQAIMLLRLGRFWIRRAYYKHFEPKLFNIRYPHENVDFYTRHFFAALKKVQSTLG